MAFPHHLVVRARCSKRWRGANFDKAAAEGNVGAALAHLWSIDPKTQAGLDALLHRAFVRAYGEGLHPNPAAPFDPSVGEAFEFHVGLRFDAAADERSRVERAVMAAVEASRNFSAQGAAWT